MTEQKNSTGIKVVLIVIVSLFLIIITCCVSLYVIGSNQAKKDAEIQKQLEIEKEAKIDGLTQEAQAFYKALPETYQDKFLGLSTENQATLISLPENGLAIFLRLDHAEQNEFLDMTDSERTTFIQNEKDLQVKYETLTDEQKKAYSTLSKEGRKIYLNLSDEQKSTFSQLRAEVKQTFFDKTDQERLDILRQKAEEVKQKELALKRKEMIDYPEKYLEITPKNWYLGGFGSVAIHSLSIKNTSEVDYKDIKLQFVYSGNSGTILSTNSYTIYDTIPAGQTKTFNELNVGFVNSQVTNSSVTLDSWSPAKVAE